MSSELILPIAMRWVHIISAIILIGGSFFIRMILQPGLRAALNEDEQEKLKGAISKRWQTICHFLILMFLVSGLYNLTLSLPKHEGQGLYYTLFAVKFTLALVVFFLVEALNSAKDWSQKIRDNMALWAGLTLMLAFLVVLISNTLKNLPLSQ